MHNWFECKIRYEKVAENGMNKKVTEPYLVDALSFTEAESRIIEEITPFISGEFTVSDIKRANYSELFFCEDDEADKWFKCKLYFITLDEKSGAEKKTATNVLVQAADLKDSIKKLDEGMKRKERCRKEDSHKRTGSGCRPERFNQETGRRHEGYNGRLRDSLCSRNCHNGCLSIFSRTGR